MLNLSTRAQCESGYQAYSDDVMFSPVSLQSLCVCSAVHRISSVSVIDLTC